MNREQRRQALRDGADPQDVADTRVLRLSDYMDPAEDHQAVRRWELWRILNWYHEQIARQNTPAKCFWRWLTRKPFIVYHPGELLRLYQLKRKALEEEAKKNGNAR